MSLRDERTTAADVALALSGMAAGILTKRKAAGQSVRAAAAEIGVPFNSLSRAERCIGEPSASVLLAILRWLDVPGWGECEHALRSAGTVEPEDTRPVAEQLAAALKAGAAIVCYTRCYACQFGCCFDPPEPHTWGAEDDFEHARATGQPDPGNCGCSCARVPQ